MAIGDLPGFTVASGPDAPNPRPYRDALVAEWNRLVNSEDIQLEKVAQKFLERHPSLIPGSHGSHMKYGKWPWPGAVISQPRLPGIAERKPDFLWIASNTTHLLPVLIEIERPDKRWFKRKTLKPHSDFKDANQQIHEWRKWFQDPLNHLNFVRDYKLPDDISRLRVEVQYILIHGRHEEFGDDIERLQDRAAREVEHLRLMTFDTLLPDANAMSYGTVKLDVDKRYKALSAPAMLEVNSLWSRFLNDTDGWQETIENSPDIGSERKQRLLSELAEAYVATRGADQRNPIPGRRRK
ncbi:DUF4263 domain-containing protein (plasmid) [Rhodococcus opacus]|uniref:Shedu anti-phage system protein SduA domain-containing protein n=1 Tax=Rhodococcus opacus TaxID=37919 RepID=UPI00146E2734|nr:DUF4263 domain-containing protein [Rhodococcus opacus]